MIRKMVLLGLALALSLPAMASPEQEGQIEELEKLTRERINARCADKWGDDFKMQKWCRQKQAQGLVDVGAWMQRHEVTDPKKDKTAWGKILRKCFTKWTDRFGPNWPMVIWCAQKQEDAYRSL